MNKLLQNTNPRWYRDKYLGLIAMLSLLVGAVRLFSSWPPDHDSLKSGLRLLALGAVALLLSSQRLMTLGAGVAFVGSRVLIGIFLYHFPPLLGLFVAGACGLVVLTLLWAFKDYSPPYEIRTYTALELGIDSLVFCAILFLMIRIDVL
jgi:hypothetical protein